MRNCFTEESFACYLEMLPNSPGRGPKFLEKPGPGPGPAVIGTGRDPDLYLSSEIEEI